MENNDSVVKIDVRIIVSDLDIASIVSKAVNNAQLEKEYNIVISSIVPTTDIEIAKKVVNDADIILIGGYGQDETYNILFNELKTDFNHVGLFDYNNFLQDNNTLNIEIAQKEILNSIIKSTLSYSLNLINIHALENKLRKITDEYNELREEYNKVVKENEVFVIENNELREDFTKLTNDFKEFRNRFEDIHTKSFLEIYKLDDLWFEVFNEEFVDNERIIIATNNFKPDNIIVGQGFIGAESKNQAIDWLKIVKTALIFVENSNNNLNNDLNSTDSEESFDYQDDSGNSITFENFFD